MPLAHILYSDGQLRIKQVIEEQHTAIRIEFGKIYGKEKPSPFDEYLGCTIRDDYGEI